MGATDVYRPPNIAPSPTSSPPSLLPHQDQNPNCAPPARSPCSPARAHTSKKSIFRYSVGLRAASRLRAFAGYWYSPPSVCSEL
ncbi:hypothetical protein GALMADRAFT_1147324 [Galerina marginata CBS 339.88]|uniref:Uncharacterized protein n=1 Tax=Galerina marginata (strain CBS 339.88) TaxID=685588 RepID=A0A067SIL0_GALM3|nr:hypothetical protein GALMADRAFT_1147324 [Galerina marginata CBS 339.88]